MVTGGFRLDHLGAGAGLQAGQQHRRLHLGRGLGQPIGKVVEISALERQRQPPIGAPRPGRPHLAERPQHPAHRPAAQRLIAREGRREVEPSHGAHDQAHAGAGVAAIDHVGGFGKTATSLDAPLAWAKLLDAGAEATHGLGGAQHIVPFKKPFDLGDALRQRAQDEGSVRDRLVAWGAHAAPQRAAALRGQSC